MSKLSLGKSLVNLEQNIKDDAMRPCICIMVAVLLFMSALIIFCPDKIIRYISLIIILIVIFFTMYINNYFAKNDPDRLQTEKYLTNKHMIEAGLLEDKKVITDNRVLSSSLLEDEADSYD